MGIQLHTLQAFFLFFVSLILIRGIFAYWDNLLVSSQGEKFVRNLRETIFSEQINWPPELFKRQYFGKYLLRYTGDMKAIQNYLSRGVLAGIRDVGFLTIGFLLLFLINSDIALIYFLMASVSILAVYLLNKLQRKRILTSRTNRNKMVAHVSKSFQLQARNIERERTDKVINRFNRISDSLFMSNVKNSRFESIMLAVFSVLQFIMIGIVLYAVTFKNLFDINAADALIFVLIMLLMNAAMKRVLKVPSYIQKGRISFEKIDRLMSKKLHVVQEEAGQSDDDYE